MWAALVLLPPRSAALLTAAVEGLHVETNPLYRAGRLAAGTTWCNLFVSDLTALLGCPIPFRPANQQLQYLESFDAARAGWLELSGLARIAQAIARAAQGMPVVPAWSNPKGHGHIAMARPGPAGRLFIAQAGLRNFSSEPITNGFGVLPYRLFTHQ